MRKTVVAWAAVAGSFAMYAGAAFAQGDQTLARNLAATCANCHGTGGKAQGMIPSLAGLPKSDLVQKMNEFRDGKRAAAIMHQIAKGYTPEQIDLLSGWLAQQK